mmetsp:Transcript_24526/g.44359  ORF Transcript_24526/g.44359 Transcript_24526/m.44359 type:complete len:227 (-) Transcript_24526:1611-2291(-)
MAKCTTLDILSSDAHMVSLQEECSIGHGLSRSPVNGRSLLRHVHTSLENLGHLSMQLKVLGDATCRTTHMLQCFDLDSSGTNATPLLWTLETRPPGTEPICLLHLIAFGCFQIGLITLERKFANFLAFLLGQGTFLNQALFKQHESRWMAANLFVEFGLCKGRLIQFVVTIATVAHHIDNDIRSPLVTPLHCRLQRRRNGKGIIPIAVENGAIESLAQVGTIGCRT